MGQSLNLIQSSLDQLEEQLSKEFSTYGDLASELALYAAGGRGKRLRPVLLFLSGKLFGELDGRHVKAATSIELIHTATLIHDDIIDEAQIRRKKPSLNKAYGPELAVMTGDLILSHAMGILVSLPDNLPAQLITQSTNEICEGEMLQTFRRFHLGISEDEYYEVIEKKTATLFDVSSRLGALFSGASEEETKILGTFGRTIGIAFQIVDDCLDIVGNENDLGKSLGTDMKKGKLTLPFIRLLARLSGEEKKNLEECMSPPLTVEKMGELKKVLQLNGAVEEAVQVATDQVKKAKNDLACLKNLKPEAQEKLFELTEAIFEPLKEKKPALK